MAKSYLGVAGGLLMVCLMSDSQAAEAENAFVKVVGESSVYRLEQKGDTDFNAYCREVSPATFLISPLDGWELVTPANGSLAITPGTSGVWQVKSQLREDKPKGKIYLWDYFIKAEGYNSKDITVPFGKEVKYFSYEGPNAVNSDWDVSGYEKSKQKSDTDSIIFSRSFWNITEWFTESYSTPKPGVYEIKANLTGKPSVTDAGQMTVVGAQIIENITHPYGFDDYSNWSLGPTDYYGDREGHCTLPYASVCAGDQGIAYLTVDPTSNTKEIQITSAVSETDLDLSPITTIASTDLAFTPASSWFPQTTTVTAKMDDTPLAKMEVTSHDLRQYNCLIVCVTSNGGTNIPSFSGSCYRCNDVYKQVAFRFTTGKTWYNYVNFPANAKWTQNDLDALAETFLNDSPNELGKYDFFVFIIEGYDTEKASVTGRGAIGGNYTWLYTDNPSSTYLAPHELGHNFGLYNQFTSQGETKVLGPDRDNLMNDSNNWRLRKSQWETCRRHHVK